jgi:hypothetical protein
MLMIMFNQTLPENAQTCDQMSSIQPCCTEEADPDLPFHQLTLYKNNDADYYIWSLKTIHTELQSNAQKYKITNQIKIKI